MNSKDTSGGIPPHYDPATFEDKWYQQWEEGGHFVPGSDNDREAFTLMMPPPNVTGYLHMGHALVSTLQDLVTRRQRMCGKNTLWLPGTDHAGIATQAVVERALANEGTSRKELGREAFIEKVWQWKKDKGGRITYQLRKLGASCDWTRERFTLDDGLSKAVREVFVSLFEQDLIYRGTYMVNWCPSCGTAISDLEVEHQDQQGHLWHLKYPVADSDQFLTVATTRPETMLGDTAVAVHPEDERYQSLVGKKVNLPLMDRPIPIIADDMVDREFGTGVVKITPAHDPNDYQAGKRNNLDSIQVIGKDGKITGAGGPYEGLDRLEARKKVLADLEAKGFLEKVEDHGHAVGGCQRCGTTVEPLVSTQWFVRVETMAAKAKKAVVDGETRIVPERWEKTYFQWMDNIHDWCISRQLWWGHQIPAWYCQPCGKTLVSRQDLESCPDCNGKVTRDPDVLDTWFSSSLWPFSTLGWPEKTPDFNRHFPTSLLITGFDILFFWVARMMMMSLHFTDKAPFKEVFIHGLVRDSEGRKMSKSLGNIIDPLDLIAEYGTDALRFTLAIMCVPGTDIPLDPKRMEGYRSFATKVWNATRFSLMNLEGWEGSVEPPTQSHGHPEKWILFRYDQTLEKMDHAFSEYRFYEAADLLYHFVWGDFCDWYLEAAKATLGLEDEAGEASRQTLAFILDGILRLLHPFMPFITEELWSHLPWTTGNIIDAPWPVSTGQGKTNEAPHDTFEDIKEFIQRSRNIRSILNMKPSARPKARVLAASPNQILSESWVLKLAGLEAVECVSNQDDLFSGPKEACKMGTISLESSSADLEAEKLRMEKELEKLEKEAGKWRSKLSNEAFLAKAPAHVVERQQGILKELEEKSDQLKRVLESL